MKKVKRLICICILIIILLLFLIISVFTIDQKKRKEAGGISSSEIVLPQKEPIPQTLEDGNNEISGTKEEIVAEEQIQDSGITDSDGVNKEERGSNETKNSETSNPGNIIIENISNQNFFKNNGVAIVSFHITTDSKSLPTHIMVNEQKLPMLAGENGRYYIEYLVAGNVKEEVLNITSAIIDGKSYPIQATALVEQRRNPFAISDVKFEDKTLKWNLSDIDSSFVSAVLTIKTKDNQTVLSKELTANDTGASLTALASNKEYVYTITGTYKEDKAATATNDLSWSGSFFFGVDTANNSGSSSGTSEGSSGGGSNGGSQGSGSSGGSQPAKIEYVTADLDFRDIEYVNLYYQGAKTQSVDKNHSLDDYYLEVKPKYAPKLYVGVKEFAEGTLESEVYAVADLEDFISYEKNSKGVLEKKEHTAFLFEREGDGGDAGQSPAAVFFDKIKANPGGTYTLTEDLDASAIGLDSGYVINKTFTGVLEGNGYTIYNLQGTLFNTIKGGKVNNLIIEDASVSDAKSILAATINNNAVIDGVKLIDCSLSTNTDSVGGIGGNVQGSKILNSAVIDCNITGNNTIGGIAGQIGANGYVENCVVRARMSGTQSGNNNGTRVAGITGWLNSAATVKKCYVEVTISAPDKKGCGGIFGAPGSGAGTIENCFAKVTGSGYQIGGFDAALDKVSSTYQLASASNKNSATGISDLTSFTENTFKTKLGISANLWEDLKVDTSLLEETSVLKAVSGYQKSREKAYLNLMKLAPLLDRKQVVSLGNQVTGNLAKKKIMGVYPYDSNGDLMITLDGNNADSVKNIKVVYEGASFESYDVTHDALSDGIVTIYKIEKLNLPYHFGNYVNDDLLGLEQYVAGAANSLSYDTEIANVFSNGVVRQYKEVYEDEITPKLEEYAKMLVGTEYGSATGNSYLKANLKSDIDNELPKMLYTYTYYMKAYDFVMGGVNMADLFYFNSELLNSEITLQYLIKELKGSNRALNSAYSNYKNQIESKSGIELYDQFELILSMAGVKDYNQWFVDYFKGYVKEQNPIGYTPTPALKWRAWDILTNLYDSHCQLLNVLTIPEDIQPQIGIMTTAGQILFTDINLYYSAVNETNINAFKSTIDSVAKYYGLYTGSTLNYVVNGEKNLNDDICIGYDSILDYKWQNPQYQNVATAESDGPLIKYIIQPANKIYTANVGASCDGKYIMYGYMSALSYNSFMTFTHENAHGQDMTYFLNGAGRRYGTNGEHYASGLFAEPSTLSKGSGDITINRISNFDITDDYICAFSYERVNTLKEIQDFYKKLYDTSYAMNRIMGNAVLALTPQQRYRALVYTRVNPEGEVKPASMTVEYTYANYEYTNMYNINTFEQLYDSRLNYKEIGSGGKTYTEANYWEVSWFTPENPDGICDAKTFKDMAHELLGYYGWDKGLIGWASDRYANDVEAIKGITGYNSMKEYKMAKFNEAEKKAKTIPYFDSKRMEDIFVQVFKDAPSRADMDYGMWARKIVIAAIKRITDDFTDGDMYHAPKKVYSIKSASDLVSLVNANANTKGLYIKLTGDIDMSEVTGASGYFAENFMGILDGQGHTIRGLSKPLFKGTKWAVVSNVTLEGSSNGLLSKGGSYTLVYDCKKAADKAMFASGTLDDNQLMEYFTTEPAGE